MPRGFTTNVADLLKFSAAKESRAEEHSTVELTLTGATMPARTYYLATAKLTINGIVYERDLREVGALRQSITRAVDRTEYAVENVSSLLGSDWINNPDEIQGATVKVGRYWRDLESGQEFHEIVFRGVVQSPKADQNTARVQVLSDIYAASIGGGRRVARKCQWKFRDPLTCGYTGVEIVCNKLLNSAGGCSGRSNQHRYGGFVFIQPSSSVSGASATPPPASNQSLKFTDGVSVVSFKQQPFVTLEGGLGLENDDTNNATRIMGKAAVVGSQISDVNNIDGGLDSLHALAIVPGSLRANGDWLDVFTSGGTAANANTKQYVLRIDGNTILDTGTQVLNNFTWRVWLRIVRLSSTTVKVSAAFEGTTPTGTNPFSIFQLYFPVTVQNLDSSSNTLQSLGQSGGAVSGDITEIMMEIAAFRQ